MIRSARRLLPLLLLFAFISTTAQPVYNNADPKPYKISSNGRQMTLKSSRPIKTVMMWTSDGNRIVEHHDINNSSFSFTVPSNNKLLFLMVALDGGKVYTEKIGIK
jgi:hypothetical protein